MSNLLQEVYQLVIVDIGPVLDIDRFTIGGNSIFGVYILLVSKVTILSRDAFSVV